MPPLDTARLLTALQDQFSVNDLIRAGVVDQLSAVSSAPLRISERVANAGTLIELRRGKDIDDYLLPTGCLSGQIPVLATLAGFQARANCSHQRSLWLTRTFDDACWFNYLDEHACVMPELEPLTGDDLRQFCGDLGRPLAADQNRRRTQARVELILVDGALTADQSSSSRDTQQFIEFLNRLQLCFGFTADGIRKWKPTAADRDGFGFLSRHADRDLVQDHFRRIASGASLAFPDAVPRQKDPTMIVDALRAYAMALRHDVIRADFDDARHSTVGAIRTLCLDPLFSMVEQSPDIIARNYWLALALHCQRLHRVLLDIYTANQVVEQRGSTPSRTPDVRWPEVDKLLMRIFSITERIERCRIQTALRRPLRVG
jgi:hypothetical protein